MLYAATMFLAALLSDNRLPVAADASGGHSFSYEGADGPDHWAEHDPACAGKMQSPIDIEERLVKTRKFGPLKFDGFDQMPVSSTLSNNGHTVMLEMNFTRSASLSGGPLGGTYVFRQLHFHWGNNDSVGSETLVNNHTYPLEMHIVTYKQEYGSFSNAQKYKDGLAVLAVFFKICGYRNRYYSEITRKLPLVQQPNSQVHLDHGVTLHSLLPEKKELYFTYKGSLTTPPCLEVVTWIDFKQPVLISNDQVKAFRTLYSQEGRRMINLRPVQPLNNRTVFSNIDDRYWWFINPQQFIFDMFRG